MEAIPIGLDLAAFDRVKSRFLHWMLLDEKEGLICIAEAEDVKLALRLVGELHAKLARGETPTLEEEKEAGEKAREAREARAARAAREAREARAKKQADKLLELLREAK